MKNLRIVTTRVDCSLTRFFVIEAIITVTLIDWQLLHQRGEFLHKLQAKAVQIRWERFFLNV